MATTTFQTVIAECEAFKVEFEGSVLSRVELAFLRGQQSQMEEELVRLEKEVA